MKLGVVWRGQNSKNEKFEISPEVQLSRGEVRSKFSSFFVATLFRTVIHDSSSPFCYEASQYLLLNWVGCASHNSSKARHGVDRNFISTYSRVHLPPNKLVRTEHVYCPWSFYSNYGSVKEKKEMEEAREWLILIVSCEGSVELSRNFPFIYSSCGFL